MVIPFIEGFEALPGSVGHGVLPATPAGAHAVRTAVQHGLNLVQLTVIDLEQFRKFKRPRDSRTDGNRTPVRSLEGVVLARSVVEKDERKHHAPLYVHHRI